jgi:spore coat polysaccharide biosynthesis predicted glycosyltransferase SpsG/RimJ/RimL family protein N-acetyltransferase
VITSLHTSFKKIVQLSDSGPKAELDSILSFNPAVVVIDDYSINADYHYSLSQKGCQVVSIDDLHNRYFYCDVIINTAGGVNIALYENAPWCQFYTGPDHALLREHFNRQNDFSASSRTDNLLICFGGADPDNKTREVLELVLGNSSFKKIHVVVGSAYLHGSSLRNLSSDNTVNIYRNVSEKELASLMKTCGTAICSPSSVAYEYLSIGGNLFLYQTAQNQRDAMAYLLTSGMAFTWPAFGKVNDKEVHAAIEKQKTVFDGKSPYRLKGIFNQLFEARTWTIRKVTENDRSSCLEWSNDPDVRVQSYNTSAIDEATHNEWFTRKLEDPYSWFYILESNNVPFAQIRFQVSDNTATLGYLISSSHRGKGHGAAVLASGIKEFIRDYGSPVVLIAFVKMTNIASSKSFEKFNFKKSIASEHPESYKYTLKHEGNTVWA